MAIQEKIKLNEDVLDVVQGGVSIPTDTPEFVIPDWPPVDQRPDIQPPRPAPNPFAPQKEKDE